jgi:hypothetical protein
MYPRPLTCVRSGAREATVLRIAEPGIVPRYLSPRQVSEQFGLSVSLLCVLRSQGGGPPFARVGKRGSRKPKILYAERDVEAWFAANRTECASDSRDL